MKAIKGFEKDLSCRGFQFEEGKTFTQDAPAELCRTGFHAVLQPIDVFRYYPPATSIYHEVELTDVEGPEAEDSKVAAREISIGARIELPALIKAQIDFVFKNAKKPGKDGVSTEDNGIARTRKKNGAATASGYSGAATASGNQSIAIVTGRHGRARGRLGAWLVLTERDLDWNILGVVAVPVDGKTVKADTWYTLCSGQVVEP